jgi:hypothetical protein
MAPVARTLRAFDRGSRFNGLARWDFASMAAGMGGEGHRVGTRAELAAALGWPGRTPRAGTSN